VPVEKKPTARDCLLDFTGSPPDSRLVTSLMGDGTRTTFIGGGLLARCQGDPQVITADSAEQYESAGMLNLIGNVVFVEPGKIRISAPSASYFTGEEKIVAYGGVTATDLPTGSTFNGPTIEYLRAGSRRPFARLYAPQRPSLRLVEVDSTGASTPPINITASQMESRDDGPLAAWGDVVVTREQIVAQGDSGSFDQDAGLARLIRNAFVFSRDSTQAFRLVGDTIDLYSTDRVLERVVAKHRARATSNDVSMRAERVEMQLDSQQVNRAWAYGPGRAYAETATQSLEADSIEIRMPAQVVEAVHAVGRAFAFGMPDSARIREPERDVLAGDTIVASFDTLTTPPDTSPKSVLRLVTAIGSASSRYQIPSARGPDVLPAISYIRGKRIRAFFEDGEMRNVEVDSQAVGLYLEPEPDTSAYADSVRRARADSLLPDSLHADSLRADSLRADSLRRDSLARPRVPPDTIGPSAHAPLPVGAGGLLAYAMTPRDAVAPSRRGQPAWRRRRSFTLPAPSHPA
jgi:lipopolysaccharide export system protein LptA